VIGLSEFRESEIRQLGVSVLCHQYVCRLYVAVQDAGRMSNRQAIGNAG
jgi:hypothetical protein